MFKIAGIMGIVLAVVLGGFYWYYKDSQARIESLLADRGQLLANVSVLKDAVQTNENTIDSLLADIELGNQIKSQLDNELQSTRAQNRELVNRLAEHDVGALAFSRPGLVERTINNASANAARCFELVTGAQLTERELNAKTPREFNSECPWLFDSLVAIGR
jgi:AcrR family transcriptional regulator